MLAQCGLYLGEAAQLDIAGKDHRNAKGYWEHARFRSLIERLQEHLAAQHGHLSLMPQGWEEDEGLAAFYDEARRLVAETFQGHEPWGWKFPQTALIVPFWLKVVPGLKFVLCVRNPLDVMASLVSYGGFSPSEGPMIWLHNNLRLLLDTAPCQRAVTFYEDYFPDYRKGLLPLLDFVGLPRPEAGSELDTKLGGFIQSDLKHHNSSAEDLLADSEIPYVVKELYVELLAGGRNAADLPLLRNVELFMPLASRIVVAHTQTHRLRHLEDILNSRTHRIASAVCSLLIRLRAASGRSDHPARAMADALTLPVAQQSSSEQQQRLKLGRHKKSAREGATRTSRI